MENKQKFIDECAIAAMGGIFSVNSEYTMGNINLPAEELRSSAFMVFLRYCQEIKMKFFIIKN